MITYCANYIFAQNVVVELLLYGTEPCPMSDAQLKGP